MNEKREKEFYNRVFGFQVWDVSPELIESALKAVKFKPQLMKSLSRLDEVVKRIINFTNEIVFCSTDKQVIGNLIFDMADRLTRFLKVIFEKTYQVTMTDSYYQALLEVLFLSVYLSFDREKNKDFVTQRLLVRGYASGYSYNTLINYINIHKNSRKINLLSMQSAVENLSEAKQEIEDLFYSVKQKYKKNTITKNRPMLLMAAILFAMVSLFLGNGILFSAFILVGFLFVASKIHDRYTNREVSSVVKEEYLEKLPELYSVCKTLNLSQENRQVIKLIIGDSASVLDQINSNQKNRINLFKNWIKKNPQKALKISIALHGFSIDHLEWKQTGVTEALSSRIEEKKKLNRLPICKLAYGNSSEVESSFPDEVVKKARAVYKQTRTKKISRESEVTSKNSLSTYTRVTRRYQLSPALQAQGILALGDEKHPSKGFFKYGDCKKEINEAIGAKVEDGVLERGFLAPYGEFDGFKRLTKTSAELKLPGRDRGIFFKTGQHIQVPDNEGNVHKVPCYGLEKLGQKRSS